MFVALISVSFSLCVVYFAFVSTTFFMCVFVLCVCGFVSPRDWFLLLFVVSIVFFYTYNHIHPNVSPYTHPIPHVCDLYVPVLFIGKLLINFVKVIKKKFW